MYLITSELAGLLAVILPVFIVLLILEQRTFSVADKIIDVPEEDKPVARAWIAGRRLALLVSNVLSVVLCLLIVQLGDQGFSDLNEVAGMGNGLFMSAVALSTLIYASSLAVLAFLTISAYRIAFADIVDAPEFEAALGRSDVKPS